MLKSINQCLFAVMELYICVMTTDLAFLADLYCIKELRHCITYTYPASKVSRNWHECKNNIHPSFVVSCNETVRQDHGRVKMVVHDKRVGNLLQPSTCGTK